jgi:hypothetical protein
MFAAALVPLIEATPNTSTFLGKPGNQTNPEMQNAGSQVGWWLQWTHAYGGNGHSQYAQPVGDIDGDGVNEVIIGGYENSGICRIMYYNTTQNTYVEEYSWQEAGGDPSGASIADLNGDGNLILCVSWAYSSADGVYAYKYDGTTLTMLDYYHGTGVDFVFDIYSCDYNNDGALEVMIANAPNMGTGNKHVTALGWDIATQKFYYETSWSCPGGSSMECPMVWSGDVDNDGLTEVIADVSSGQSSTAGTWTLNWNPDNQTWYGIPVWTNYGSATVYGDGAADVNGDGTLEIGIGGYGGTPQGWLFEWDGSTYQQVWNGQYPGQSPTIESVALGDADNDGQNEFCFGTGHVHVIGWNGTGYYEKATFTDPTGMLAGMNIGDFDSDGKNELKGCEILSGTGSEFIWKYGAGNQRPVADFSWVPQNPNLGQLVTFDASASHDPDGYITAYQWDWDNDGVYDETHTTPTATHSWSDAGNYPVKLKVIDNNSATDVITKIVSVQNSPPNPPTIQAPGKGKAGVTYLCSFNTTDPDGDNVYYYIDWGDNSTTGWIGPSVSGATIHQSHAWTTQGTYTIKAKAKDTNGAESDWGTLQVVMPLSYEPPHYRIFQWLFERFPHAFPILRHLLGY